MSSVIEDYWQTVFDKYRCGPRTFRIPGLHDPIMSANFDENKLTSHGHYNCVSRFSNASSVFKLGVLNSDQNQDLKLNAVVKTLKSAGKSQAYSELLKLGFPGDFKYLEKISELLSHSKHEHFNISLQKNGEIVAMLNIGLSPNIALMFNCVVAPKERQNGYCRELTMQAKAFTAGQGIDQLFFWTKHPRLISIADHKFDYNIIRHDAQISS